MPRRQMLVGLCCAGLLGPTIPFAQTIPNKPIRIVTSSAGTGTDFVSRLIAPALTASFGQPAFVENRSGVLSTEAVLKAPPDGTTLLLAGSNFWIGPLFQKSSYDPVADFIPITALTNSYYILVVHPSLPVRSVRELIDLAKRRPAELNYGSSAIGGGTHLAAELFKAMAGVNIVRVNYHIVSQSITDLIGGQLQTMFPVSVSVTEHVKSGRLRALAVTKSEPSTLFPDLPTVAATVPGYESGSMFALFAPAKTPASIINRLNQETVRFIKTVEAKERLAPLGVEPVGSSPGEFAVMMKAEMLKYGKVAKGLDM